MDLVIFHEHSYVLAKTSGHVDDSAAELFRTHLHPIVGARGANVILDLSGSPRINSAGIARLVLLVTDANTNGSRVVLAAPSPFVTGVLRISHLDRFFTLTESVSEAVDNLLPNQVTASAKSD